MPEKLFAIDALSHIYQFFYAIKGLTGPDGEPVNAVYGFARLLEKLHRDYGADYMVVAFDGAGELERKKEYEQYKANRKPMPDALERQLPLVEQLLTAHSIPYLSLEGHEADDLLATIAEKARQMGLETVIVTTDKDAEQLIDEQISVLHMHKDREVIMGPDELKERKGIRPEQVVEVMSLAGDTSDNIPGVPGIGPKTAQKLIREFGSVENLYKSLDRVSGEKTRQNLKEHRDNVDQARELVKLRRDLPLELEWETARIGPEDPGEVKRFYRALGFHSLLEKGDPPAKPTERQGSLFSIEPQAATVTLETGEKNYDTVSDLEGLRRLADRLREQEEVSFDLETTSLELRNAAIVGLAFSWQPNQGVYVPVKGPRGGVQVCPLDRALQILKPVLEAETPGKTGQNLKYDIAVLKNYGIELGGVAGDAMVASYLLRPASRSHGLDALAKRHLNYETVKIEQLIGRGKQQLTMDRVPVEQVAPYACEDADLAYQLCRGLGEELKAEDLWDLYIELELPLIPVLAQMEWRGIRVDTAALEDMSRSFEGQLKELERQIWQEAGREFNVNSPQQLSTVLFEEMELPPPRGRRTQTGYSTASDVLNALKQEHPIADYVLEYRELSKLKSTYADALLQMVNTETGRVHCSFNQTVTATGRLSSSEPNLQNIPVRTELGRRIRTAFTAGEPDMSLLSADYSQVELRVMAHCSGDPALSRAFRQGRDIHRFVAAQVNGVDEADVTGEMRQRAKAVNFGIIYGQSPYGLSNQLGISVEDAEDFINRYFERYPRVKEFIGRTIDRARQLGYVKTLAGRKRRVEGIRGGGATRSAAERIAVNTVIQGSAADLIKRAMISIDRRLPKVSPRAGMLLQIHDELVFEVPDEELEQVTQFVVDQMSGALEMDVPLKVDTAVGKNWAETK